MRGCLAASFICFVQCTYLVLLLCSHNMHQYGAFFANVRQSIQDGTFDKHTELFVDTFGTEPKRTGEIHASQAAVEAALTKRNRLNEVDDENSEAAEAAKERRKQKDALRLEKRAKKKEEGLK